MQEAGAQWGYADTDRRQVLTGYLSYLDKGRSDILASLSVRYQTGTPYSLVYSKDMNADGHASNDRFFANGPGLRSQHPAGGSQLFMDLGLRRDFMLTKAEDDRLPGCF
ncbi:MAG: hypothetical protein IPI84_06715 [Holophagaceae bacterium]|nr:hypothetical protein [Holophagaceae bacterium]